MSSQVQTTQPRSLTIGESPDVWDLGQILHPTEALKIQTYYMAHVPRRFRPVGGLRLSFTDVTAGEIEYGISVGNEGQLLFHNGFLNWQYTYPVDSFVIPYVEFAQWVKDSGLTPGAAMRLGISAINGVGYGFAFYGLRAQFIGYWEN